MDLDPIFGENQPINPYLELIYSREKNGVDRPLISIPNDCRSHSRDVEGIGTMPPSNFGCWEQVANKIKSRNDSKAIDSIDPSNC